MQPFPGFLQFPLTVLAWVTVVVLVHDLGALPMAFFAGFLLERRYGLSRQPARSWLHDHLKAGAINLAFVGAAAVVDVRLARAVAPTAGGFRPGPAWLPPPS